MSECTMIRVRHVILTSLYRIHGGGDWATTIGNLGNLVSAEARCSPCDSRLLLDAVQYVASSDGIGIHKYIEGERIVLTPSSPHFREALLSGDFRVVGSPKARAAFEALSVTN